MTRAEKFLKENKARQYGNIDCEDIGILMTPDKDELFFTLPELLTSYAESLNQSEAENQCIEFAEWVGPNYQAGTNPKDEVQWINIESYRVYTTSELYQKFKQQEK